MLGTRKRDRREDKQEEEDKRLVAEFRVRKLIQSNNTDASRPTAELATLSGGYETNEDEFQSADEKATEESAVATMMTMTTTLQN